MKKKLTDQQLLLAYHKGRIKGGKNRAKTAKRGKLGRYLPK